MKISLIDVLKAQLVGKKLRHKNQYNRVVTLEIEDVKTTNHSEDLERATRENDWYPASRDWTETRIHFVDGSSIKTYDGEELDIVD